MTFAWKRLVTAILVVWPIWLLQLRRCQIADWSEGSLITPRPPLVGRAAGVC